MDLASGRPRAEIAREIGIDLDSVCRFADQADVEEEVKKKAVRLLEALITLLIWPLNKMDHTRFHE